MCTFLSKTTPTRPLTHAQTHTRTRTKSLTYISSDNHKDDTVNHSQKKTGGETQAEVESSLDRVKGDKRVLFAAVWCAWMPWGRKGGRERRRRTLSLPLGCN